MGCSRVLYEGDNHKVVAIRVEDEDLANGHISTNQFLIISGNESVILDPGGRVSFIQIFEECLRYVKARDIKYIILSHQDPDVGSSLPEWLLETPANVIVSSVWSRFISQFGIMDTGKLIEIEDSGYKLTLKSGNIIKILPAHFLHSISNFNIYDETSKILFSGDLCVSVMSDGEEYDEVSDFQAHISHMQAFHERYMCSSAAINEWLKLIKKLDIKIIAPQHGAIFTKENVQKQLAWLSGIKCGLDFLQERYKTDLV